MSASPDAPSSRRRYGVVIPVYNAAAALPEVLQGLADIRPRLPAGSELAVVVVDDGSAPALTLAGPPDLPVTLLRHGENRGKGAALKTGFAHLLGRPGVAAVITMDADLQHRPGDLPRFVRRFEERGEGLIVGCRPRDPGVMPAHRILSNAITSGIISAMVHQLVPDSQCGYRLYSAETLRAIDLSENRFHMESEALIRAGWARVRLGAVPIPTIYNGAPSAIRNLPDTLNFIAVVWRLIRERMMGHV